MNINEFIAQVRPLGHFRYEAPLATRYFMLSYDQAVPGLEGDFRHFIIAALHARGATRLKSYVASTIYFEAPATEGHTHQAMVNWRTFLQEVFGPHATFGYMLVAIRHYTNGNRAFQYQSYQTMEPEFDAIYADIGRRF